MEKFYIKMIEVFSRSLGLNFWDWLSFIISSIAVVIAIVTLYISKKTLASQEQTQINTAPVINRKIQKALLDKLNLGILDSYVRLFAIKCKLEESNYDCVPIDWILLEMKLPTDSVHVDLFYDDQVAFGLFDLLQARIKNFNLKLDVFNKHIKTQLSSENKKYELLSLLLALSLIQSSCKEISEKIYNVKKYETTLIKIKDKLVKVYESYDLQLIATETDYLFEEDEFSNAFIDKVKRREFRSFMNSLIEVTLLNLESSMINPSSLKSFEI